MRRIRIFNAGNLSTGLTVMLDHNASHHLVQVLRKKVGERFWVFNGKGGEFEATLVSSAKKTACIQVGEFHHRDTESPLSIHLGQSVSRGERMDYAIQKATELGVTEITPLMTEYCQVQLAENRIDKRVAHWKSIAISAAEQSGRCAIPTIHSPILFSQWIKRDEPIKFICCARQKDKPANLSLSSLKGNVSVAIGPEGGFSDLEIKTALEENLVLFPLGPRVLRTETATVVALTLLQEHAGDLALG